MHWINVTFYLLCVIVSYPIRGIIVKYICMCSNKANVESCSTLAKSLCLQQNMRFLEIDSQIRVCVCMCANSCSKRNTTYPFKDVIRHRHDV